MRDQAGEAGGAGWVDRASTPVLASPSRLRLAVFAANVAGGSNLTTAPEALSGTWRDSVAIATAADRAGFEALIPVARWRGLATPGRRAAHRTFETFTWASAVAAVTARVQVFATAHVPLQHPVQVAKMIATIDHVSGGRFGLNVVAGWNDLELRMFGAHAQDTAEDRYAVASEWLRFLRRIWSQDEEFSEHGEWFSGERVLSEPRPLQRPGPVVMGAGSSVAGREFAAEHADLHVALLPTLEGAAEVVSAAKRAAAAHGRELAVWAPVHIVCAATEAEAWAAHDRAVNEVADHEAATAALRLLLPDGVPDEATRASLAASAVTGFFALPLVGTPEQVVEGMSALSSAGVDGLALSWLDYAAGIADYERLLLPLLTAARLRVG